MCWVFFFTNNVLLRRILYEAMCCVFVFFPSIFVLLARYATVKLFVHSGVNLSGNDSLFSTGRKNSAKNISAIYYSSFALFADVIFRNLQILTGFAGVVHKGEISVVRAVKELIILTRNIGHIHVMGRWTNVLILSVSEDIQGDQVDLGVAVLAGLGGGHLHNLAGTTLDHDKSTFTESRTLHRISGGCSGIGRGEIEIISHFVGWFLTNIKTN